MTSAQASEFDQVVLKKSITAGAIGVLVHWFDWALYAYLATTIADVFFPSQDPTAALLSVFAVFAVSFAVRPLGSLVFGPLGDRIGRRKTLSVVILLMAAGTLTVGLLPSYQTIGITAPILLIVSRILQGLAAGGEFGSAATFLAEYSPRKHRGFGVSWLEVGSLLGFLGASLSVFVLNEALSDAAVSGWGWRLPFLLAAPLGVIGYYIRVKIEDTPEFLELERLDDVPQAPMRELFRRNKKQLVQMSGVEIMQHVSFYVVLVYLLTYQAEQVGLSSANAAMASTVTSIVALVLVPVFGTLSDHIGRKPVLMGAGAGMLVLSYPLFALMHQGTVLSVVASQAGLGVLLAAVLGTHAVAMSEIFPTRTRQGGLSIGYNVTAAIFAGTVPYLMTWLISATGASFVPSYYLMLVGLVGLIATSTLKETKGTALRRSHEQPAQDEPVPHVSHASTSAATKA